MTCKCVKNTSGEGKCNSNCGGHSGNDCNTDADCQNSKNSYTIDQFKTILKNRYKVQYNIKGGSKKISSDLSEWTDIKLNDDHPNAKQVYEDIKHLYGKPYILVNKNGGIAIWNKEQIKEKGDYVHYEIILRDEAVEHCVPASHYDFLTSYVKVFIPKDKIMNVLSVSGSVSYDGLKKLLSARCANLEANYATLRTCLKKLNNKDEDYKTNIENRNENSKQNKDSVIKMLKDNNEKYVKEMKLPYYELAFPDGC